MRAWTEWIPVVVPPDYAGCAVYQFRQMHHSLVAPIPRWGGIDPEGILVIGETQNMAERWKQSRSAIAKGGGSSTLNLLNYIVGYSGYLNKYLVDDHDYEYRFIRLDSKELAEAEEAELILLYICQFFEPPPLNSEVPSRYVDDLWDKCSGIVFPPTV